ncbi:pirin family protein [Antarcticibacterium flavum]|uniref:Pirin family protein n=1 Tax=Antarcticibacterium flavum TaxID=2058175 RepID=A0A5B7WYZ8_9FLAO|nr:MULTISPECIES: pirin family protein [Antarcticibacterium]MCM4158965.1 nuclease PIN [Antarcticibacterium sp. W02-3]QCY68217.1 pirin family protein [Antarcticibacterium flavum]
MRTIKKIHTAEYRPIADLKTYSPMPTRDLEMIDPFLFLNHHGPQTYGPNNNGLPFGPHPHRGMETVTFILDGDISHKDSGGHESVIYSGGVQWMTAGSGLLHAEVSSSDFKKFGGDLEILQLWVNLPAKLKMTEPRYEGLQQDEIPTTVFDEGKINASVVSGNFEGTKGAFDILTDITLTTINFKENSKLELKVPKDKNIFFYLIKGEVRVNQQIVQSLHLVEFQNDDEELQIEALADSTLLFGFAKPFNEPVVARGPFVMNTMQEINQAYDDFQAGRLGRWQD